MSIEPANKALVLHRPHETTDSLLRQLSRIGLEAHCSWPDLPEGFDPIGCGVTFFDADMGYDEQFPWPAGDSPMPTIALIGSEAPGRVAWAIRRGADAHLFKPIAGGGVFSALLIAREAFVRRQALRAEVESLQHRLGRRETLAEATALLMLGKGLSAVEAYKALRRRAMDQRLSVEDMAAQLVAQAGTARGHGRA